MLQSVLPVVGYVVCLDTGSTDDTTHEVAQFLQQQGIRHRVSETVFSGFGEARNQAIELIPAEFEWILMLDADEILLPKDYAQLASLVTDESHDVWCLPRFNWSDKIWGTHTKAYPDYQGRLFRNDAGKAIRYDGEIHETLIGYKNAAFVPLSGDHNGFSDALHIHHLKLLQKSHAELQAREELYQAIIRSRAEREAARPAREAALKAIWGGDDPFANPSAFEGHIDFQGWASDHPYLARAIDEVRPRVVAEIGVWKGGSTITMAEHMRSIGHNGVVVSIDTWLGSWDHWLQPQWFPHLRFESGYPSIFKTFMANIVEKQLQPYVVPLPLDSLNAAVVFKARGLEPGVVHIDAAHDFASVLRDLQAWWPLLKPGGILIGDDYHHSGNTWPEVRAAFQQFFATTEIEATGGKCYIRKPSNP
jgi:predicted O-methyltransferase YrrM